MLHFLKVFYYFSPVTGKLWACWVRCVFLCSCFSRDTVKNENQCFHWQSFIYESIHSSIDPITLRLQKEIGFLDFIQTGSSNLGLLIRENPHRQDESRSLQATYNEPHHRRVNMQRSRADSCVMVIFTRRRFTDYTSKPNPYNTLLLFVSMVWSITENTDGLQ